MQFPLEMMNTVFFLGDETHEGKHLRGTGFFASVPSETRAESVYLYLVTASHCVWDWVEDRPRSGLFMRINTAEGVIDSSIGDGNDWFFHPDPAPRVDLAVWPVSGEGGVDLFNLGYKWVPRRMLFDESDIGDDPNRGVGLSDDVVAIGLFTNHVGRERNQPITRTGSIAMIPTEPVGTNPTMGRMHVYLVELRSIAGMSGSPVFVRHRSMVGEDAKASLLGVLLGHFQADEADAGGALVSTGIGMVAPARLLGEVLDQDDLARMRVDADNRARDLDSGVSPDNGADSAHS